MCQGRFRGRGKDDHLRVEPVDRTVQIPGRLLQVLHGVAFVPCPQQILERLADQIPGDSIRRTSHNIFNHLDRFNAAFGVMRW